MSRYASAHAELLRFELDRPIGGSGVTAVDVVVVDLEDDRGNCGFGFSYGLGGAGEVMLAAGGNLLARFVRDKAVVHPFALWRRLAASLNRVGRGASYLAVAAIDLAAWDMHARSLQVPLGIALGGEMRAVPVYGSAGFRPGVSDDEVLARCRTYLEQGCRAVKLRLTGSAEDAVTLATMRAALPSNIDIMVDVNEKCDLVRAQWLATECERYGVLWLEEPLPAHDIDGYRALVGRTAVPVAGGEHLQGQVEFGPYIKDGMFAVAQPDLAMSGGMSECLRIAQLAEACNVSVSPHFLPSLFIHLAAVAPNIHWLEHFPLLEPMFEDLPDVEQGLQIPRDSVGHGMRLVSDARRKYAVT